jgi:hypothetical protein
MTSLEDRLNEPEPERWEPEPGDSLVGTVEALEQRVGSWKPYLVVDIRQDDGEIRRWFATHTVAKSELAKLRPKAGERIGVRYLGTHAKGYENWRVVLDRGEEPAAAAPVDWDAVGKETEDKPPATGEQPEDEWLPPDADEPPY